VRQSAFDADVPMILLVFLSCFFASASHHGGSTKKNDDVGRVPSMRCSAPSYIADSQPCIVFVRPVNEQALRMRGGESPGACGRSRLAQHRCPLCCSARRIASSWSARGTVQEPGDDVLSETTYRQMIQRRNSACEQVGRLKVRLLVTPKPICLVTAATTGTTSIGSVFMILAPGPSL